MPGTGMLIQGLSLLSKWHDVGDDFFGRNLFSSTEHTALGGRGHPPDEYHQVSG